MAYTIVNRTTECRGEDWLKTAFTGSLYREEDCLQAAQTEACYEAVTGNEVVLRLVLRRAAAWPAWKYSRELLVYFQPHANLPAIGAEALHSLLNDVALHTAETVICLLSAETAAFGEILTGAGFVRLGGINRVKHAGEEREYVFYCLKKERQA